MTDLMALNGELMSQKYEYAGFWIRTAASIIDSLITAFILFPLMFLFYGDFEAMQNQQVLGFDVLLQYVLPLLYTVLFWIYLGGTPGKRLFALKVLDEATGHKVTAGQAVIRYLGYIPSTIVLLLGFFWVAFDAKKQGWHDKMAKTVVVREL